MNNAPDNSREDLDHAANSGADGSAITSPFNYSVNEDVERQKAMDRATEKVPNDPSRPIL